MSTQAMIGYGSEVYLWDPDAGPAAYVKLGEVTNITPPNLSTDKVDASNMDSPNRFREYIPGMTDPGECTVEFNWIPGSATDELIRARRAAGDNQNVKFVYPNGAVEVFLASVIGYEKSSPFDDKLTATLTLQVSGESVWS